MIKEASFPLVSRLIAAPGYDRWGDIIPKSLRRSVARGGLGKNQTVSIIRNIAYNFPLLFDEFALRDVMEHTLQTHIPAPKSRAFIQTACSLGILDCSNVLPRYQLDPLLSQRVFHLDYSHERKAARRRTRNCTPSI